jgi:hypothetical protein
MRLLGEAGTYVSFTYGKLSAAVGQAGEDAFTATGAGARFLPSDAASVAILPVNGGTRLP